VANYYSVHVRSLSKHNCSNATKQLVRLSHEPFTINPGRTQIHLSFMPNGPRTREVIFAIALMLIKSIVTSFRSKRASKSRLELSSPFILDRDDITQYRRALDLELNDELTIEPLQMPIFLSAVTEPAMLLLLASRSCPINALGAVNVRNRLELVDPISLIYHSYSSIRGRL
jgi:hypothetical protein